MTPLRFLAVCVLVNANAALAQNTWYVDVNGVPPGSGTQGDPYTSIQYGIDQPSTGQGDTFLIAPGVYEENVATETHVRLVGAQGPDETVLRATDGGPVVDVLVLIELEGLTLHGYRGDPSEAVGVRVQLHAAVFITRCVIRGCTRGVLNDYDCSINESTISQNEEGVAVTSFAVLWMRNSIAWGNTTDIACSGSNPIAFVDYCAGLNSTFCNGSGGNNLFGDPGMWDMERADFRLKPGSPCVDAGDPASAPDPDGSRIDIGAFTYDPDYAPEPFAYCTGKLNSKGCVPAIRYSGQPSATSADPFDITAANVVEGKSGLLIYGYERWAIPFQGGFHCVRPPTPRAGHQIAGSDGALPCPGTFGFDFNTRIQGGADAALVPGITVYAQYWQRDLNEPAGFGTGLSNALCFGIAP